MSDDREAELERRFWRATEAFNHGDLDGAAANYGDETRYQVARDHPESRVCIGRDEIRAYQSTWHEHMDEIRFEAEDFVIRWPYALALGRISGRGTGSGLELEVELALLYETDADWQVIGVEEFLDHDEARRRFESGASPAPRQA